MALEKVLEMFARIRKYTALTVAATVAVLTIVTALPGVASAEVAAPYTTVLASTVTASKFAATDSVRLTAVSQRTVVEAAAAGTVTRTGTSASGSELSRARAILAGLVAKHPILKGTTVSIGDARGYQAIAYYKSGRIVISSTHTATLSRILNHEVWHVIDWRDNGRIDWGENIPPRQ